ncbi:methyltransferase [Methanococcoides sp. SA1]|nr:methyltransferase [Methanococcoides sp. SA1]
MNNLPITDEVLTRIYEMSLAPVQTNAMIAGVELAIFDYLVEPMRAEELANKYSFDGRATKEFLNVLVACDLLIKKDGVYQNSQEANQFLVSNHPTYYGSHLLMNYERYSMSPNTISEMVRNGPPSQKKEEGMSSENFWAQHARSMANWERAGTAQMLADIIEALPEFSSMQKMLDLGGGPGLMGIATLSRHPSMKGIVFDQPSVIPVTEDFIAEYNLSERMTTVGGDYINGPIGGGYDLILASCTLNFAKDCMDPMIKKIYDALNPDGVFVSLHEGIYNEGTSPAIPVLCIMESALSGFNCLLDKGFIANAMLNAGFKSVRSQPITLDAGPLELDIARKAPEEIVD